MNIKRITAEDLSCIEDAKKETYPDEAYAYIDANFKLLRHHNKYVTTGMEAFTVDEKMLDTCIMLVSEVSPFSDDTSQNVLEHLMMHREQLSTSNNKSVSPAPARKNKKDKYARADILVNLIAALIPGEPLADEDASNAIAEIIERESRGNSIIWHLDIRTGDYNNVFAVPLEMKYSESGDFESVSILGSKVPDDLSGEALKMVSRLEVIL